MTSERATTGQGGKESSMQRIFADFSRLGMHGPGHESEIDLGYDNSPNLAGHELREGERAIFYETGSLEAIGILISTSEVTPDGQQRRFWIAQLDMATLRSLDQSSGAEELPPYVHSAAPGTTTES